MGNWLSKFVIGFLALVLLAVMVSFSTVLLQTYREYTHFQGVENTARVRLQELRTEQERKEEYLRLVLADSAFLERVVREKLGYVRPNETIFIFDNE